MRPYHRFLSQAAKPACGYALIFVLIFTIALTLLALTSVQIATLQERMAGHSRDHNTAFQATETVLRLAESSLVGASVFTFTNSCTNGLCNNGAAPDIATYDWTNGTQHATLLLTATPSLRSTLAQNPKYFIEYAGQLKKAGKKGGWAQVFRSTGRSVGEDANTVVFLQSTYEQ